MAKFKKKRRMIKQVTPADPFDNDPSRISYKDVSLLKKFITTRGRILPTEKTGVTPRCQKKLTLAIKRARFLSLIPFTQYV